MDREWAVIRDAASLVTRCVIDGCGWTFEGTAGEGREAAELHRQKSHPVLPGDLRREAERKAARETRAAALAAKPTAAAPAIDPDRAPRQRGQWTKRQVVVALVRFIGENGRTPTQKDWLHRGEWWPSWSTAARQYGNSWSAAKAAGRAEFERQPLTCHSCQKVGSRDILDRECGHFAGCVIGQTLPEREQDQAMGVRPAALEPIVASERTDPGDVKVGTETPPPFRQLDMIAICDTLGQLADTLTALQRLLTPA